MKIKFLSLLISCLVISGFSGCAVKQEQDLSQKEVVVEKQAPKKVAKKTKRKSKTSRLQRQMMKKPTTKHNRPKLRKKAQKSHINI